MSETAANSDVRFVWPGGERAAISLSFDDGRRSQLEHGIPIFDRYGIKATFYVSPGNMMQRLDGWRAAVTKGYEIGNHTLSHPCSGNFRFARGRALENYTLEQMEDEMLQANQVILQELGIVPVTFAYPCGQTFVGRGKNVRSYVPLVAEHFLVGRAWFAETPNAPDFCDLAQVGSYDVDQMPLDRMIALVERAVAECGWTIFTGHDIRPEPGRQVTQTEVLEGLCRYLNDRRSEIWTDTVAAVGRYIHQIREGNGDQQQLSSEE